MMEELFVGDLNIKERTFKVDFWIRLIDALSIKKPFRSFRNAVEDEGILDDWYAYNDAYLQMYVRDRL